MPLVARAAWRFLRSDLVFQLFVAFLPKNIETEIIELFPRIKERRKASSPLAARCKQADLASSSPCLLFPFRRNGKTTLCLINATHHEVSLRVCAKFPARSWVSTETQHCCCCSRSLHTVMCSFLFSFFFPPFFFPFSFFPFLFSPFFFSPFLFFPFLVFSLFFFPFSCLFFFFLSLPFSFFPAGRFLRYCCLVGAGTCPVSPIRLQHLG